MLAATGGPDGVVASSFGWEADAVAVRGAIDCLEAADDAVRVAIEGLDRQLRARPWWPARRRRDRRRPRTCSPSIPASPSTRSTGWAGPLLAPASLTLLYGDPGRPVVSPYPAAARAPRQPGLGARPARAPARGRRAVGPPGLPRQRHRSRCRRSPARTAPCGTSSTCRAPTTSTRRGTRTPTSATWRPTSTLMAGQPDAYQQGILEALRPGRRRHRRAGAARRPLAGRHGGGRDPGRPRRLPRHRRRHRGLADRAGAGLPQRLARALPRAAGRHRPRARRRPQPRLGRADHGDLRRPPRRRRDRPPLLRRLRARAPALVDAATDPSVTDAVGSLHDHGFLGAGGQVTSQVFQITRAP